MLRLTLVTGNPNKLEEARRILAAEAGRGGRRPPELDSVELDLPEIQSLDLGEVLAAKAEEAWRRLGPGHGAGDRDRSHPGTRRLLVVEETGLEIDAFGGFPGPLVKWMLEAVGAEGIVRAARGLLRERGEDPTAPRALARCRLLALGDHLGTRRRVSGEGVEPGTLVLPGRGDGGFGWDPVFLPEGEKRTYGELPGEVKDRIGHRGRAWRDLVAKL